MAITYFAITSTDPDGTHNLDLPEAVATREILGIVRVWTAGEPPTPSDNFVVIGIDIRPQDSNRLRSISTQIKQRMLQEFQKTLDRSRASLADYGRSRGKNFRADVCLSATDVANL